MVPTRGPAGSRGARTAAALLVPLLLAAAPALAPSGDPPQKPAVDGREHREDPNGAVARHGSAPSLADAVQRIADCSGSCAGIVYLWSARMPLSLQGVVEARSAAAALGVELTLVESERAHRDAELAGAWGDARRALADALLGSGALAHAPALVVHRGGRIAGPAILGYKPAEVYGAMIERRLTEPVDVRSGRAGAMQSSRPAHAGIGGDAVVPEPWPRAPEREAGRRRADFEAVGTPGAYFRWVPEHASLAYESGNRVWLLDLDDGESRLGPGFIDFVPTPDGRYFVTPGAHDRGLELYDAAEVLDAARRGRGQDVDPLFTDPGMRDQYPSVGILEADAERTVYRVLTSWFEGVVYRDYEIEHDAVRRPRVRPRAAPVVPCRGSSLSIPILSPNGLEVAARDETNGTTRVFGLGPRGRCSEVADVGVHTTKVAWHRSGRLLAFARPRLRAARAEPDRTTVGIFLFDRDAPTRVARVRGSEGASALAFPDFVGEDALVFLVPATREEEPNTFRVVDGIR